MIDDPEVQKLLKAANLTGDQWLRSQIEKAIGAKAIQRQIQPFPKTLPTVWNDEQRVTLGTTLTGSNYDLYQEILSQHLLAIGQSGAGKTSLFYNLSDQLDVPFWAFDLKQDYRHLIKDRDDLLVLPWRELRFNPLKPPEDVPPRRWAQVLAEIFGHATALLSGSKNHLMRKVAELYGLYDLFDESSPPFPSLHELQLLIERDPINYVRKTANYRDTVNNRLDTMTFATDNLFACSAGYPVEELLERNVVFEFDGLGNDLQNFLMEILFAYVYEYRLAQNQRGGELRHVFFLDEGKRVFSVYKERQDAAGIPEIDALTAKMREFGEGLVIADQEASKLTDSIKANTYTKVLLPTGDAKQFNEIADSMHLTEWQRQLAKKVGIGEAIVQTGNQDPIPVKLDRYDLEKTVSDERLADRQKRQWNQLTYEPRTTNAAFEAAISRDNEPDQQEQPVQGEDDLEISEAAVRILKDVAENPFKPLSDRYRLLANDYKGNKAKDEIVDAGLVVERNIRNKPKKRKLLQLTERGREILADKDIQVKRDGRGGIVHRFWQHQIKELFENNRWAPKLELFDADVYVNFGSSELAVEVAMGKKEREMEHVKQHLDRGIDQVWIFCRNEEVRDGLQERLDQNGLLDERVTFRLFSDVSVEDNGLIEELGRFDTSEKET